MRFLNSSIQYFNSPAFTSAATLYSSATIFILMQSEDSPVIINLCSAISQNREPNFLRASACVIEDVCTCMELGISEMNAIFSTIVAILTDAQIPHDIKSCFLKALSACLSNLDEILENQQNRASLYQLLLSTLSIPGDSKTQSYRCFTRLARYPFFAECAGQVFTAAIQDLSKPSDPSIVYFICQLIKRVSSTDRITKIGIISTFFDQLFSILLQFAENHPSYQESDSNAPHIAAADALVQIMTAVPMEKSQAAITAYIQSQRSLEVSIILAGSLSQIGSVGSSFFELCSTGLSSEDPRVLEQALFLLKTLIGNMELPYDTVVPRLIELISVSGVGLVSCDTLCHLIETVNLQPLCMPTFSSIVQLLTTTQTMEEQLMFSIFNVLGKLVQCWASDEELSNFIQFLVGIIGQGSDPVYYFAGDVFKRCKHMMDMQMIGSFVEALTKEASTSGCLALSCLSCEAIVGPVTGMIMTLLNENQPVDHVNELVIAAQNLMENCDIGGAVGQLGQLLVKHLETFAQDEDCVHLTMIVFTKIIKKYMDEGAGSIIPALKIISNSFSSFVSYDFDQDAILYMLEIINNVPNSAEFVDYALDLIASIAEHEVSMIVDGEPTTNENSLRMQSTLALFCVGVESTRPDSIKEMLAQNENVTALMQHMLQNEETRNIVVRLLTMCGIPVK